MSQVLPTTPPTATPDESAQPATALLREFGQWLQVWTSRVQEQVAQLEASTPAAQNDAETEPQTVAQAEEQAALPPGAPVEAEAPSLQGQAGPALSALPPHWLERVQQAAPPAHWLLHVQQRLQEQAPPPAPLVDGAELLDDRLSTPSADSDAAVQPDAAQSTPAIEPQDNGTAAVSVARPDTQVLATLASWLDEMQIDAELLLQAATTIAEHRTNTRSLASDKSSALAASAQPQAPDHDGSEPVAVADQALYSTPQGSHPPLADEASYTEPTKVTTPISKAAQSPEAGATPPAQSARRDNLASLPASSTSRRQTHLRLNLVQSPGQQPTEEMVPPKPAVDSNAVEGEYTAQVDPSQPSFGRADVASAQPVGQTAGNQNNALIRLDSVGKSQRGELGSNQVRPEPATPHPGADQRPTKEPERPVQPANLWPPLPGEQLFADAQRVERPNAPARQEQGRTISAAQWPRLPAAPATLAQHDQVTHQPDAVHELDGQPKPSAPASSATERWPALLAERAPSLPDWRRERYQQARRQRLDQEQHGTRSLSD